MTRSEDEGMERVESSRYHGYVIWLTQDDRTGRWRYNLARADRHGQPVDRADETETFGPFTSRAAAEADAEARIRSLSPDIRRAG